MKQLININEWARKEHYLFFSKFEEPFFGVTIQVDCTKAYQKAKEQHRSFFLYYLYRALSAVNEIENFRYSIHEGNVYLFEAVHASPTINRPGGSFGFGYIDYEKEEQLFYEKALAEIERVQGSTALLPSVSGQNVIHFSAIPWLNFTALSHARSFSFADSAPKISFGKMTEKDGTRTMPVSIHVHHGLADGYHVGLFAEKFQQLLDKE